MRDFFVQALVFLLGALIGIAVPLLPKTGQKWTAGIVSVLLICTALTWAGYEVGYKEGIKSVPTSTTEPEVSYQIVFQSNRDGNWEIYKANIDGSGQVNLTNHPDNDGFASVSPDGNKIVFLSGRDRDGDGSDIYIMNNNGSQLLRLTQEGIHWDPIWSPDGKMIAFGSNTTPDNSLQIFIMNADGTGKRQVTLEATLTPAVPTWSPDGGKLAFCAGNPEKGFEIYIINIDGTERTRVTYDPGKTNCSPSWSPNGELIAFDSNRDGETEIYTVNLKSGIQARLTRNQKGNFKPKWSSDGKYIAYYSTRDGSSQIYVMRADGTGQTQVTSLGSNRNPSFFPSIP